ncbi:MAG: hypothetical protein AAGJ11_14435 [Bacteroidota bacterium]
MNGVAIASGVAAAGAIVASARAAGFDRDRSFYPTVLVVIALLYVLFGVEDGAASVVAAETAVALGFVAVAVVAFHRRSPVLLAAGLALHGLWDVTHPAILPASDAVPAWWPAFCLGVDLPLAAWVYARWPPRSHAEVPAPSRGAGPAAP